MKQVPAALWIWSDLDRRATNVFAYFRIELKWPAGAVRARIDASASSKYLLGIDGNELGFGPSLSDPAFPFLDSYAVDRPSGHSASVLWATAYCLGENTPIMTEHNKGRAGFLCQVRFLDAQGNTLRTVSTGRTKGWKCLLPPSRPREAMRQSLWNGYHEIVDLTKEPRDWKTTGFDDSSWTTPRMILNRRLDFGTLLPRDIPHLVSHPVNYQDFSFEPMKGRLEQQGAGFLIDATTPGSFPALLFDFGKPIVGWPTLQISGGIAGSLSLWYGETLDLARTDTFILDGGSHVLSPFMTRAFRYLRVSFNGSDSPCFLASVKLRTWEYPLKPVGVFHCDREDLNTVAQISRYTVQLSARDNWEGSITRETQSWVADSRIMGQVGFWCFGETALTQHEIRQFLRIPHADGTIPATGPQKNNFAIPGFNAWFILWVCEYWQRTADREFFLETLPGLWKVVEFFESQKDSDGLVRNCLRKGWWCFTDWAPIDNSDADSCTNAALVVAWNRLKTVLEEVGGTQFADKIALLSRGAQRTSAGFQSQLRHPTLPVFVDGLNGTQPSASVSWQANVLAIHAGIVPAAEVPAVLDCLLATPEAVPIQSAYMLSFLMEVLFEQGRTEMALAKSDAYWGEMARRGAQTWWETFVVGSPRTAIPYQFSVNCPSYMAEHIPPSTCHGWSSAPAYLFPRYLGGLKPTKPGWTEFVLDPAPRGLQNCHIELPVPGGVLKVTWERRQGKIVVLNWEAPPGVTLK